MLFLLGFITGIGVTVVGIFSPILIRRRKPPSKEEWKSGYTPD